MGEQEILVHNATCHQSKEWRAERKRYWKEQAEKGGDSTWYELTDKNLDRMKQGKAPWGRDKKLVQLHHTKGIAVDMYDYVEMGADAHRLFHKSFGYKDFIDLREFLAIC